MMERAKIVAAIVDLERDSRDDSVFLYDVKQKVSGVDPVSFEAALVQLRDADAIELWGLEIHTGEEAAGRFLSGVTVGGLYYEFVRLKKKIDLESSTRPHNT